MQIFRVEHRETGFGPYRHRQDGMRWVELDPDRYHRCCSAEFCPAPYYENHNIKSIFDGGQYDKWFFGFASCDQIKSWFGNKILRHLKRDGFVISIYEVDEADVESSKFQSTFIKANATKIADVPFDRI